MQLHPLIMDVIDDIEHKGMVTWRSDLGSCKGLKATKPKDRGDVLASAVHALGKPSEHGLSNTDALMSVLCALMTVKSNRSWKSVALSQDNVDVLLDALHGDPVLPGWLLARLRTALLAAQESGLTVHPFFRLYTGPLAAERGTESIRARRESFPHPAGPLAPGPKDELQLLGDEIASLEQAQRAHPQWARPEGWHSSKAHAVAMCEWFGKGPATRATQKGAVGYETWGWWRVRTFQLRSWGTTLRPTLEIWLSALSPETPWPPPSPTSRSAPSPSGSQPAHVTLWLFSLMGPKHGEKTPWRTANPAAFLDPWWADDVVPWMEQMSTLTLLLDDAPGGIPVTERPTKKVVKAALRRARTK